jgi:hypothetical protein
MGLETSCLAWGTGHAGSGFRLVESADRDDDDDDDNSGYECCFYRPSADGIMLIV